MARTLILGDIHLDKQFPYTLPESSSAEAWLKYKLSMLTQLVNPVQSVIQLGDMFDTHDASGYYLMTAQSLFKDKDLMFPLGNHDVSYRRLPSNSNLLRNVLKIPTSIDDRVTVIDHCLTQEIFDTNIDALIRSGKGEVLVLHCNVGNPRVSHENWLTEEKLDRLSSQYRYVLLGHEHKHEQLTKNAWYVGTPYPTNFGEMYDHYVGYLDEEDLWFNKTFKADEEYMELDIQELVDLETTLGTFDLTIKKPVRFIKLVGSVSVEDGAKAFRWLKKLRSLSHVIAVKGEFTVRPYKSISGSESKSEFKDFSRLLAEHVSESEIQFLDSLL